MLKKALALFVVALAISGGIFVSHARADFDCLTLTPTSSQDQKNFCQGELNDLNQQLADLNAQLLEQQKQTGTIKGDITALTTQIQALKTKIKARSVAIAQLKVDITDKVSKIETLSQKLDREHESLAQLLRKTNQMDATPTMYFMLADSSLSDFYKDADSFATINESIKQSADQVRGTKSETETEKKNLETKRNQELDAKAELESAQQQFAKTQADKKQLLTISTQKESAYKQLAAEKKARADKIRAALFNLAGGSKAIPFGDAYQFAKQAQGKTGVAPAFLLAILTQETNLGGNVGKCYLTNTDTGAGFNIDTKATFPNVMKPSRDIQPFLQITSSLGFNPSTTVVSCPIKGVAGYGGGMGPAQFIASTWKIIESRVASLLGVGAPNPWEPRDAFMASALYLSDLGASGTSYSSQIRAACKYYGTGGSNCSYGRSVMGLMSRIQSSQIDPLEN